MVVYYYKIEFVSNESFVKEKTEYPKKSTRSLPALLYKEYSKGKVFILVPAQLAQSALLFLHLSDCSSNPHCSRD